MENLYLVFVYRVVALWGLENKFWCKASDMLPVFLDLAFSLQSHCLTSERMKDTIMLVCVYVCVSYIVRTYFWCMQYQVLVMVYGVQTQIGCFILFLVTRFF